MNKVKEHFIRHWRLLWVPGFSLCIGKHNGKSSIWIETKSIVYALDLWVE